MKNKNQSP